MRMIDYYLAFVFIVAIVWVLRLDSLTLVQKLFVLLFIYGIVLIYQNPVQVERFISGFNDYLK